ncbi:MAG: T9SS type A sorting domain-containing protein, partial [bacterium]
RSEIKDINIWDISITKNTNEPITLSWEGDFPDGYDAWLIEGNQAIDMRKSQESGVKSRELKVKIMKPNSGLIIETLEITNITTYPNPAKNEATIRISAKTSNANLKMEVYNILGQKVREESFGLLPSRFSQSEQAYIYEAGYSCTNAFNQKLSNGLYFLKIIASEDNKETSKLSRMLIKK